MCLGRFALSDFFLFKEQRFKIKVEREAQLQDVHHGSLEFELPPKTLFTFNYVNGMDFKVDSFTGAKITYLVFTDEPPEILLSLEHSFPPGSFCQVWAELGRAGKVKRRISADFSVDKVVLAAHHVSSTWHLGCKLKRNTCNTHLGQASHDLGTCEPHGLFASCLLSLEREGPPFAMAATAGDGEGDQDVVLTERLPPWDPCLSPWDSFQPDYAFRRGSVSLSLGCI